MQSAKKDLYSVLIPTYNEKENLPIIVFLLMETAQKSGFDLEVVVVDDNSPDGTGDVAESLKKVYPNKITLLRRAGKLGLGSAYIDGLSYCKGNFIVLMDADLSHHPKYLPDFINKQKSTNADIVTGTRYRKGAGVYGWNLHRKLTSRVANFIAKTMLGSPYTDLTGSFRLYKREVIDKIIREIVSKGYAFQMEIIIRANSLGYKIEECPIVFVDRLYGESKLGPNEIAIYLRGVYKLFWSF